MAESTIWIKRSRSGKFLGGKALENYPSLAAGYCLTRHSQQADVQPFGAEAPSTLTLESAPHIVAIILGIDVHPSESQS